MEERYQPKYIKCMDCGIEMKDVETLRPYSVTIDGQKHYPLCGVCMINRLIAARETADE